MNCPMCGVGTLTPMTYTNVFRDVRVWGLEANTCSHCDAEPIMTGQIKRNEHRIKDAREEHEAMNETQEPEIYEPFPKGSAPEGRPDEYVSLAAYRALQQHSARQTVVIRRMVNRSANDATEKSNG
jgi:hypothetical protein